MKSRVLTRLLLSNPSKSLLPPIPSRLHPSAFLSSNPRRPTRSDNPNDESEDFFLRNLDFGGQDDGKKDERSDLGDLSGDFEKSLEVGGEGKKKVFGEERSAVSGDFAERFDLGRKQRFDDSRSFAKSFDFGNKVESSVSDDQSKVRLSRELGIGNDGEGQKPPQAKYSNPGLAETSPEDADEIFKKMKETGLIPNAVAMLDGLCKDGLVQEAMRLFGLMREKGTIPEVVIYTAVVEGFCKVAKYDDANRIFRKMQSNGVMPNAFSYGVLIRGLCKGKRLEDCVEWCFEMLDAGHSPNVATFTTLVDAICKEKGVEEAEKVVRRFRERGLGLDDKVVRDHLDKKGPFSPLVQEAILGKKKYTKAF